MQIILIVVGKTEPPFYTEEVEKYLSRLRRFITFEMKVIPELRNSTNMTEDMIRNREGDAILQNVKADDCLVLLDERGKEFDSVQFAGFVNEKMVNLRGRLVFVIGGTFGFGKAVYDAATQKIALSKMTFTHQMVRVFFLEQLYRAMTIIRNIPYHH